MINVEINEDYQMIGGKVETTYNPSAPFVYDGRKDRSQETETTTTTTTPKTDSTSTVTASTELTIDNPIDSIYVNEDGKIVVLDSAGNATSYDIPKDENGDNKPVTVTDSNGSTYVVGKDGGVEKGGEDTGVTDGIAASDSTGVDSTSVVASIEGVSRNADLVVINSVSDDFQPGENRLEITYILFDTLELNFTKLEIFRLTEEDTTEVVTFTGLPQGTNLEFIDGGDNQIGWSGKGADQINVNPGQYMIKLTAAQDELYTKGLQDYEQFVVLAKELKEGDYSIVMKNSENIFSEQGYVLISADPAMPNLSFKASCQIESSVDVMFRLKIEYKRDIRQDEDYFPANGWYKAKLNELWTTDFGNKIRGGKATLYTQIGELKDTLTFYIRGANPTEQAVKDYITSQNYNVWFLTRLIRQESTYHHFNTGSNYGPEWSDSQGCPNWGPPHGWGLMQLDLLNGGQRPTAQELWSWKANVDRGYQFLNGEKRNMVNNRLNMATNVLNLWYAKDPDDIVLGHLNQVEGNITYSHVNSQNFDFDFGQEVMGQNKPFADAAWIKNYNGSSGGTDGYPGYYYLIKKIGNAKPYWDVQRTNNQGENYVEAVSNRAQ